MGRFDCIIMNITIPNKSYVIYVTTQTINKNKTGIYIRLIGKG
jgi:hypothetical protein